MLTNVRIATVAVAAITLPLSLAACGNTSDATPAPGMAPTSSAPMSSAPMSSPSMSSPSMSASSSMATPSASSSSMSTQPFGAACSTVPKTGKGSFNGMSKDPVATAASNNPALSTLVSAVKAAGLVDTLNNAQDITVFAPTNDAFKKVPAATMKKAMASPKGLLTSVLTAHVVQGRISPNQLTGRHPTLNPKAPLTVTGSGTNFTVNGTAKVVCGNVSTANATVYIVDHVLLPKS